jgi:adenosylcobinamide kinase/adenosylcobinamide-phosphate guanylyltransferase
VERETQRLVEALSEAGGPVVIVSNEVGSGIIPMNALARRYADALGILNQQVAAAADTVVFVAAGIPTILKPRPHTPEVSL